jgi:8-oxo-dGTP diphosphatase
MNDDTASLSLDIDIINSIVQDVDDIVPCDNIERDHQRNVVNWLKSGVNPFRLKKPDIPPKHLVSYFVLVDTEHRSILLVDHIKAQLWLPSGGHVKFNESPADAVVRETEEEFAIRAVFLRNIHKPFFVTVTRTVGLTPGHIDVSLWYLLRWDIHNTPHYDRKEFTDVEWYTFEEVLGTDPTIFDPHLQRFTHKLDTFLDKIN